MFPAPHGAICAALLPHVMEANLRAARLRHPANDTVRRYDDIARLLTSDPEAKADAGIDWVRTLDVLGEMAAHGARHLIELNDTKVKLPPDVAARLTPIFSTPEVDGFDATVYELR
jgi:hypothetical protein